MKYKNIKITIFKELRGIIRDRKSLLTILIMPLFIPIFIFVFGLFYQGMADGNYTVGTNYELNVNEKQILEEVSGVDVEKYDTKEDLEKAYENGEIDIYVIKDDKKYTVYYDPTKNSNSSAYQSYQMFLNSYNMYLANNYLTEQDIDTEKVFNNIEVETEEIGNTDIGMLAFIMDMVVPFMGMAILMGAITLTTDASAGEKERGTLETLLTFPIKSSDIIAGKIIATTIIGIVCGLISLLLAIGSVVVAKNTFDIFSDANVNLTLPIMLLSIFIIIVLSLLSSGICFAVSGNTKSYKEAQAALTPVSLLAMLPMFISLFEISGTWLYFIPLINCFILLDDVLFKSINYLNIMIMVVSTIVYVFIIMKYISKQYKSESTLF